MKNPRIILNEIKWKKNLNFEHVEVFIIHRGAPNNTKKILGENIKKIDRSFIYTETAMIPFHRVKEITYKNKTFFCRENL